MMKKMMWTIGAAFAAVSIWACSSSEAPGGANQGKGSCPQENPECKEIAEASAGELAVQRRRCVTCHNSDKGTMAGATTALAQQETGIELYPPNLTPDDDTGIGKWTDDNLANAIRTGLDKDGLNLCPQMKHFADMSDFEAYSIVKYLRALPPVKNQVPRSICPPLKMRDE
jgi:hypothetical protein